MAKNPFDSFSKQLLEEILSPYGAVEVSREVPGESQFVDVYFEPSSQTAITPTELELLGRIAQTSCLLEPFRNQPTPSEVRSCLLKLYQVHGDYQRKARREKEAILENDLPYLWILASSASENLLNGFGFSANHDWPSGVYFLHPSLRTAIISINQLPRNEETLFLRLLGKGQTQKQAVNEVIGFEAGDSRRSAILRLLASWKISLEITGETEAEEELMMVLTQAYLEWEQQTEQRGRQEGEQAGEVRLVLRQLTRRIGDISPDVRSQVQALSLAQLESLGEALLDFFTPSDLESWLASNVAG
ncbi:DUF4351 domain-containing protein [Synechococcales cyanobacterium C]|uniref:DUF4351 domain-containing protein n=1 Tax=Petrachloros mirabilis ULC683 TaxID=2781853 RepID=A0A8K1ZWT9_9CYAN|nr:DUF4351 domain-containing protein [Petrachloros mirabilis]NCJ06348.1 DUF4351 domain-containing protein [Petrachloros mirabilis ULC683]